MSFLLGGVASALAGVATHPLDTIKVRAQTSPPNTPLSSILSSLKFSELYAGFDASVLRSLTYATARFAVYDVVKAFLMTSVLAYSALAVKILAGCIGGAVGGAVGAPADLVNVRMQSKGKYNYNNAIDGLIRIGREEGVQAYFTGVEITVIRAILMTAGQLVTYDLAKEAILASGILGDGLPTHFLSSLLGGLVATTICAPADVVKSRIMAQRKEKPVYTGTLDAFAKIYHDEGPLAFFNGWLLAFARLAPQTILTFVILEKLKYYYAHLILVLSGGILLKYLHNVELLVTLGVTLVFLMGKGHVTF